MDSPRTLLFVCPLLLASLPAQNDVLHYKFDTGSGDTVLNFADGSQSAPRLGRIVSNGAGSWTAGRFGRGFAGLARTLTMHNRVETGWAASVNGDFTCACFLRATGGGPPPADSDILGVPVTGGFRMHAGGGPLMVEGVDATNTSYSTTANVWQLANAGWVHVAFVVDTNRSTATFYVDGARDASFAIGGGAAITGADFWIGQQLAAQRGSVYDLDEVRLLTRAATPLEVQAWSQESAATDVGFGRGCGGVMLAQNGPPRLGNGSYAVAIGSLSSGSGVLALGGSRTALGALPLPIDLGLFLSSLAGCLWHCSSELTFPMQLDLQGGGAFGLGIPASPSLLNRSVYAQALFTDFAREETTNALAVSIGR